MKSADSVEYCTLWWVTKGKNRTDLFDNKSEKCRLSYFAWKRQPLTLPLVLIPSSIVSFALLLPLLHQHGLQQEDADYRKHVYALIDSQHRALNAAGDLCYLWMRETLTTSRRTMLKSQLIASCMHNLHLLLFLVPVFLFPSANPPDLPQASSKNENFHFLSIMGVDYVFEHPQT